MQTTREVQAGISQVLLMFLYLLHHEGVWGRGGIDPGILDFELEGGVMEMPRGSNVNQGRLNIY